MPKVTDTQVRSLEPRERVYEQGFGEGLYCRVHPTGRKVFRYRYQIAGKTRILTLGDYGRGAGARTLADLLRKHTESRGVVAAGQDPALIRDEVRLETVNRRLDFEARVTLKQLCETFAKQYRGRNGQAARRTLSEYHRRIDRTIIPLWGEFPADALPVDKMITDMKGMAPVEANRLFTTIGVILNWCRRNGFDTPNPFAGRDKPGGVEKAKSRALDFDPTTNAVIKNGTEIRTFWNATESLTEDLRDALRLILLTGQRPGEVLGMRADHIVEGCWRIPSELTKNKKSIHVVPLVGLAKSIVNARSKRDFLFPDKTDSKPLKHARLSRGIKILEKDARHPLVGMKPFTPHDLRRTCASHLGELGYIDSEIGVLLNHTTSGVTNRYNQSHAAKRIRPMLAKWDRRVRSKLNNIE